MPATQSTVTSTKIIQLIAQELGVAQISYPRLLSASALRGMMNALDVFKTDVLGANKSVDRPDLSVNFEELNDLMGMKELDELEKKYTGG